MCLIGGVFAKCAPKYLMHKSWLVNLLKTCPPGVDPEVYRTTVRIVNEKVL